MPDDRLQDLCERGQAELMQTQYLQAAHTLADAERRAWESRDFDTLSRLYLPLQEARRQTRQRCGEGMVSLHCFPKTPSELVRPEVLIQACPSGQMLAGGWGTIQPPVEVRRLASEKSLYLETFLGAVFPIVDSEPVVVIVPMEQTSLPSAEPRLADQLRSLLPGGSLVLAQSEIPPDTAKGTAESFASVMSIWERLHVPMLDAAAKLFDPAQRMKAYRDILRVDPACELAHQFLADIARNLARQ